MKRLTFIVLLLLIADVSFAAVVITRGSGHCFNVVSDLKRNPIGVKRHLLLGTENILVPKKEDFVCLSIEQTRNAIGARTSASSSLRCFSSSVSKRMGFCCDEGLLVSAQLSPSLFPEPLKGSAIDRIYERPASLWITPGVMTDNEKATRRRVNMMDLDLSGKRAVVTGASLGIGEAVVKELADMGAEVVFCARSQDAVSKLASFSDKVIGLRADMGDKISTETFLDAVEEGGGADILVNNVGASPSRNFLYMTDEEWQELHELNLLSAIRCTRRLLPKMRTQKWGRVVMVASGAAKYPNAALIDYGATKAAMISISKSLSRKYGADGVLVNSILPGLIHTAMWERAAIEIAEANDTTMDKILENNGRSVPVGRYGTSEEVAAVIAFLCTNAAAYVNGVSLEVDGGSGAHI